MTRATVAICALLLALAGTSGAQPSDRDALVSRAIEGALLEDRTMVRVAAGGLRALDEREGNRSLSAGAAEALAAVTGQDSVPTRRAVRRAVPRRERTGVTESVERLAERQNRHDRLADARASRRYEARRQVINSITGAVASVLQLQFFGLIQPPLDAIDYAFVKRHYLSPEERRELAMAHALVEAESGGEVERAERIIERRIERFTRTYALQARRNGENARERGRLYEALWWLEREQALRPEGSPERAGLLEVREELQLLEAQRQRSNELGGAAGGQPAPYEADALRALLGDGDALMFSAWRLEENNRAILQAVEARRGSQRRTSLQALAASDDLAWSVRAEMLLARAEEDPDAALSEAKGTVRRRIQSWLLTGSDPREGAKVLTPEDARQLESALITSARSLFVVDAVSRTLIYPLLPGRLVSRREITDAAAQAGPAWEGTETYARARREAARAYRKSNRFERAARAAEEADRHAQAESLRQRRARRLHREFRRSDQPAERVELALRLIHGHPDFAARRQMEERLARDEVLEDSWFSISRRALRRHPELTAWEALAIPQERLRRGRGEGRMTNEGVHFLPANRIGWIDRRSDEAVVRELDPVAYRLAAARWFALDRVRRAREALDAPRERKRIPLALEGSAIPGVTVAPGLVPLDPDPEARRLYE